jgi:hypothetical protein
VQCYVAEYRKRAQPVLAVPKHQVDAYAYQLCDSLGITILEIAMPQPIGFGGGD